MNRIYRLRNSSKMLGGVAAGLSEYFDIDSTIIRLLFVIGFFSPVPTVLIYIVLWIILPVKPVALPEVKIITN